MDGNIVSVKRVIQAPPNKIFELLADPAQHSVIDGSGTVVGAKSPQGKQLELGDTFGMSMKMGIGYSMVNTVTEFEADRRITWQAKPPGRMGKFLAGRMWRYELEPVDGGTLVTESWDISQDKQRFLLKHSPLPKKTEQNMSKTLEKIEELVG